MTSCLFLEIGRTSVVQYYPRLVLLSYDLFLSGSRGSRAAGAGGGGVGGEYCSWSVACDLKRVPNRVATVASQKRGGGCDR